VKDQRTWGPFMQTEEEASLGPDLMEPRTPTGSSRRLLTLTEAAAALGVSTASIRRLVWSGRLPAVRILRRIQIDARDLDRLIEQSKEH